MIRSLTTKQALKCDHTHLTEFRTATTVFRNPGTLTSWMISHTLRDFLDDNNLGFSVIAAIRGDHHQKLQYGGAFFPCRDIQTHSTTTGRLICNWLQTIKEPEPASLDILTPVKTPTTFDGSTCFYLKNSQDLRGAELSLVRPHLPSPRPYSASPSTSFRQWVSLLWRGNDLLITFYLSWLPSTTVVFVWNQTQQQLERPTRAAGVWVSVCASLPSGIILFGRPEWKTWTTRWRVRVRRGFCLVFRLQLNPVCSVWHSKYSNFQCGSWSHFTSSSGLCLRQWNLRTIFLVRNFCFSTTQTNKRGKGKHSFSVGSGPKGCHWWTIEEYNCPGLDLQLANVFSLIWRTPVTNC